jgi:hypothetical protein
MHIICIYIYYSTYVIYTYGMYTYINVKCFHIHMYCIRNTYRGITQSTVNIKLRSESLGREPLLENIILHVSTLTLKIILSYEKILLRIHMYILRVNSSLYYCRDSG